MNGTKEVEPKEHLLNADDVREWPEDEKQEALKAIEHRDQMLAWIWQYKGYASEDVVRVALEAEHQDGVAYWWNYNTPEELAEDLRRYFVAEMQP